VGWFGSVGVSVRDGVLYLAALLKQEAAPGIVTLCLVVLLLFCVASYGFTVLRRRRAIRWLRAEIEKSSDGAEFGRSVDDISAALVKHATSHPQKQVRDAWEEYRETFVLHEEDGNEVLRNGVRPSNFFNPDDLGFSPGFWRTWPSLFVTIGLFLTFLGLISALNSMDLAADKVSASLRDLLTIASAKFIMSLTGLFCSIVFTVALRIGIGRIDDEIHGLCRAIEKRLTFISLEGLAVEQLRAAREQREHLRGLAFELVAEFGRPLRDELPAAISTSISTAMAPLFQQVGQIGADGMGNIVKDLSSQLSNDIGRALSTASDRLAQAGDRIGALADRMDQSSGRMGVEMDAAVTRLAQAVDDLRGAMGTTAETASGALTKGAEQLLSVMNQTLEGIRENTGEGARAMSSASAELRAAAEAFRGELERAASEGAEAARARMQSASADAETAIGVASRGVLDAFGRTSLEITKASETLADKATRDLLAPLERLSEQFAGLVAGIQEGSQGMRRLSDGIRAGSEATELAATSLRSASKDLVEAAAPIRSVNERVEFSVRQLTESTQRVATVVTQSAETTAKSAADTLAMAREALGGQGRSIEAALASVSAVLDQLRDQAGRFDELDEKLGKAFEVYADKVAASISTLFEHVKSMRSALEPALDTMQAIVEQAEQFAPEARRR